MNYPKHSGRRITPTLFFAVVIAILSLARFDETAAQNLALDTGFDAFHLFMTGTITVAGDSPSPRLTPSPTPCEPGTLDPSFGTGGIVSTAVGISTTGFSVAIQPDGKLVVVGSSWNGGDSDVAVVRYNVDGSLDPSFGVDGKVTTSFGTTNEAGYSVAIQPDGKIVIAGYVWDGEYDIAVLRYNADGSLDPSFGDDGKVRTDVGRDEIGLSVALQMDGKIVVAGRITIGSTMRFAAVRYNPDGSLDTTFGSDGIVTTSIGTIEDWGWSVAIQTDGKIVVTGYSRSVAGLFRFAVVRYSSDGSLDPSFDGDGKVTTHVNHTGFGFAVAIQADAKIVVTGWSYNGSGGLVTVVRYNVDGSLDTSFDDDGIVTTDLGTHDDSRAFAIQPDGKIVVVVSSSGVEKGDFVVVRYNPDGSLDTSFDGDGVVMTSITSADDNAMSIAVQPDGKLVVAGYSGTFSGNKVISVVRYGAPCITPPTQEVLFDYDGDGKSDISVFRPSDGNWYLQQSTDGFYGVNFGVGTDRIVPADYDGDGKTDVAVYRPSTGIWYVVNSSDGTFSYHAFGIEEDLPASADYDGDGKADVTVFRPSTGTWYRQNSSDGSFSIVQFGTDGDRPTVGDFDGDGKSDVAVFRPSSGVWYQQNSSDGSFFAEQFGIATDKITPADYDGDGKTDIAIYRPSEGLWYYKNSATPGTYTPHIFGIAEDIPVPGDYDGDGKADIAVFRPSNGHWYIANSSNATFTIFPWGQNGDRPTPSAFGN